MTATSNPILVKHVAENYGPGGVRTNDCAVSVDGVVITRDFAGIASRVAYKTSSTGSRNAIILSSFDGSTGQEIINVSNDASVLRKVLVEICGK